MFDQNDMAVENTAVDAVIDNDDSQIESLKSYILETPLNHDIKISSLKAELAEGRYQINCEGIASLIMAEAESV